MIFIEKIINNHRLTARQWGYDLHVLQPSACLEAQAAFWRQLPTFRPYERRGGRKKIKGKRESENRGDKIYIYMQMVKLECATDWQTNLAACLGLCAWHRYAGAELMYVKEWVWSPSYLNFLFRWCRRISRSNLRDISNYYFIKLN